MSLQKIGAKLRSPNLAVKTVKSKCSPNPQPRRSSKNPQSISTIVSTTASNTGSPRSSPKLESPSTIAPSIPNSSGQPTTIQSSELQKSSSIASPTSSSSVVDSTREASSKLCANPSSSPWEVELRLYRSRHSRRYAEALQRQGVPQAV